MVLDALQPFFLKSYLPFFIVTNELPPNFYFVLHMFYYVALYVLQNLNFFSSDTAFIVSNMMNSFIFFKIPEQKVEKNEIY